MSKQEEVNKGGRPTKYKDEYSEHVFKLCLLGATDEQLADFFNVCVATINNWKLEEPKFLESLKRGKVQADAEIANSLFNRAKGYEHKETKVFHNAMATKPEDKIVKVDLIKHYAPDTAACMAWLNNRRSQNWRNKQEVVSENINIEKKEYDYSKLSVEDLKKLKEIEQKLNKDES